MAHICISSSFVVPHVTCPIIQGLLPNVIETDLEKEKMVGRLRHIKDEFSDCGTFHAESKV
jgi:hypothetical protein